MVGFRTKSHASKLLVIVLKNVPGTELSLVLYCDVLTFLERVEVSFNLPFGVVCVLVKHYDTKERQ